MNDLQKKIKDRFQAAQRVLITSHVRPDGDAIGSSLALALALIDADKQVQVVLSDGIPANFRHLPGSDVVFTEATGRFDLIVSVDCSDLERIGKALDRYHAPDIVIDHHITTEPFGKLNLIEPDAVATASILQRHMPEWGMVITAAMAADLLTGLITDTLGFRTSNITPESLRQAADLLELGADLSAIYYQSLIKRTFAEAKYWGAGLSCLEYADGIVWATLSLADRKASGYNGKDDADLINFVSAIDDADVAIMFVEQNAAKTKISWRGLKPYIDVSQLASQFNGGGHRAASGAELSGSLAEVQQRVLEATRRILDRPRNAISGDHKEE
jgi:phosphoesterase RecJ-like protein